MSNLSLFETAPRVPKSAILSPCRTYRYELRRIWNTDLPFVNFVMLNPSTADESEDDPTIRRCIGFARDWGYGGFVVTNLFAFRATLPRDLPGPLSAAVGPENDEALKRVADECEIIVAAWGSDKAVRRRQNAVCELLRCHPFHCIKCSDLGQPYHPLYLPAVLRPIRWEPPHAD